MTETINFGQTIKRLRDEANLTQIQLARVMQDWGVTVSVTYISKIENNETKTPPSEDVVNVLARIFGKDKEIMLALAGRFDKRLLWQAVLKSPKIGFALRRLQRNDLEGAMEYLENE